MSVGEALAATFYAYAAKHGKPRWGDKTPMYMRHLGLIERLFPDAQYVHLIRDGRDAALAFLDMPEGVVTRTWAHPRSPAGFACEWRTEVRRARDLGRRLGPSRYLEIRYEELVADTGAAVVRRTVSSPAFPFEPAMLEYAGAVDVSAKPHHQRLLQPPTRGVRNWRTEMSRADDAARSRRSREIFSPSSATSFASREPAAARATVAAGLVSTRGMAAWNAAASTRPSARRCGVVGTRRSCDAVYDASTASRPGQR